MNGEAGFALQSRLASGASPLAPKGEQEGAEPVSEGEGHGSIEEPDPAAAKNPPALARPLVLLNDIQCVNEI